MCELKILLVEDNESDIKVFESTIKVYSKKNKKVIQYIVTKNKEEANAILDNSFDGAIIDMNLQSNKGEGNEVIKEIGQKYRIPIAILTGNPTEVDTTLSRFFIEIYVKGSDTLDKVIDELFKIYDTGITKIMGGRGIIEEAMNKIFWNNIYPKFNVWKEYAAATDNKTSEVALLRYIINHFQEFLDIDTGSYFSEEMYINPPIYVGLKTGSIIKNIKSGECFIVLSPACDMAIRKNGNFKTDSILLCEISRFELVMQDALKDIAKSKDQRNKLEKLLSNNHTAYFHWLAQSIDFQGGFINFRKIITYSKLDLEKFFDNPEHQVSSPFIKDIVSRFSSYYARQGQPDFNFKKMAKKLI